MFSILGYQPLCEQLPVYKGGCQTPYSILMAPQIETGIVPMFYNSLYMGGYQPLNKKFQASLSEAAGLST